MTLFAACRAAVGQHIGVDQDIPGGGYRAVKVIEGLAAHSQVATGVDERRGRAAGDDIFVFLHRVEVQLAAFAFAVVVPIDIEVARHQLHFSGELVTTVAQGVCQQAHAGATFQAAGDVLDQAAARARIIPGDVQGAEAVDVAIAVAEIIDAQRHVVAAEEQALVIDQVRGVQPDFSGAAQGAVVVQGGGIDCQVADGSQAPVVIQARASDLVECAAGNAGVLAQVHAGAGEAHVAQAADAAVAAVATGERHTEGAITGQKAVVGPGVANADQALCTEQLAAGGLGELADVEVQAPGLEHAAVGPTGSLDVQLAVGDEAAAGPGDLVGGQVERTGAGVYDAPAVIVQAGGLQVQVFVGAFKHAEAVIEQAGNIDVGRARTAHGPQVTADVVDGLRSKAQDVVAFNQAIAIAQGASEAEVDIACTDLAALTGRRALVIESLGSDLEQGIGVDTAALVIEGRGDDAAFTAECGQMPHLVEQPALGLDIQRLRLSDAVAVSEQPSDQFDPALAAVEYATGRVGYTGGFQVQVATEAVDAAALVTQGAAEAQAVIGLALQRALIVGEGAGGKVELALLAEHQAVLLVLNVTGQQLDHQVFLAGKRAFGAVIQVAIGEGQVKAILADQLAASVAQAGGVQQQGCATGQARIVGIDQRATEGAVQGALADQLASTVVEILADKGDVGGVDTPTTVENLTLGIIEAQVLSCGNQAVVAVIQATGNVEVDIGLAGDDPLIIVQAARDERLFAHADQGTRRVVIQYTGEVSVQGATLARQRALGAVVEAIADHRQTVPAGDQALVGVDHGIRFKAQLIGTEDDPAITVIDAFGGDGERRLAGDFALFSVGQVSQAREGQRTFGADQACAVFEISALQIEAHSAFADQAALALDQLLDDEFQVALG